ncbi:TrmB family transcriptional regulator [Mycobacterium lentiflavum]|uniref:Transcriptional regulator n=1 Tax=Mycobacterium lentiflavum TaxID=141349 RepID=A0ABY3UT49_MYCLN|nr:TrmB family transcriptional regulator [Mycobacterium lentiflavum]ULP41581.1 hypothetical protein MJO58_22450 [Mycobacterium lentiflavum]
MTTSEAAMVDSLRPLGFTQYEAQAYVSLLLHGEQTGYSLANLSSVPQPKAYETLRRLERRGVVIRIGDDPARFAPVPAAEVLDKAQSDFASLIDRSRREADQLVEGHQELAVCTMTKIASRQAVLNQATTLLDAATTKVYLSGHTDELKPMAEAVIAAERRGVHVILVHFGKRPFKHAGPVFRHASTEAFVYPHHQAHHVAMTVDSKRTMWATARDGHSWEGLVADDRTLASVIKLYIRHDIFVQRIYTDLRGELQALYGSGLERLGDFSPTEAEPRRRSGPGRPVAS